MNDNETHETATAIDLRRAAGDPRAQELREATVVAVAGALAALGEYLFVHGHVIGSNRVNGESPFDHGDDGVVGLATVAQIGAELAEGGQVLLKADLLYPAAALTRQLVEVEYLSWAFAEAQDEAADWLRTTREGRLKFWQPKHLRERGDGRFRATDYWEHCELGGHPTPRARTLLAGHSARQPIGIWWTDFAMHLAAIWANVRTASERAVDQLPEDLAARISSVDKVISTWQENDLLVRFETKLRQFQGTPDGEPVSRLALALGIRFAD